MKVLIVGSDGNMGRRYQSILKHLNIDTLKYDTRRVLPLEPLVRSADKIIIATPTHTHLNEISRIRHITDVDILCEKPIAKQSLKDIEFENVYMVNNYAYLHTPINHANRTRFDYYNSGNDGRFWDCIQIIALANGRFDISGHCPIWTCEINGNWIDRKLIDYSYVRMITDFLEDKEHVWDWKRTQQIHEKVLNEIEKRDKNISDWNSSQNSINETAW
jgi:hypothetical protein